MSTSPFDRRLAVPQNVATRELDGELVLLNFDTESYYGLDEVGARIWEVLRDAPSVEAGVAQLLHEFEVEEPTLRADVEALLTQLVDGGLVALEAL
jgi:hypothetical protein